MSLGGKYAFATVMGLVLPMCILTSCSSVLCVLMALGKFVNVISSLMSVMIPPHGVLRNEPARWRSLL